MRARWMLPLCLSFVLPAACGQAVAADALDIADLKVLFQTDPAAGFEGSWHLFQEPLDGEDVDGMMAIFGVVADESQRCCYGGVLRDMADSLVPIAEKQGRWVAVGDVHAARARFVNHAPRWHMVRRRLVHFIDLALEAYQKAGEDRSGESVLKSRDLQAQLCEQLYEDRVKRPDYYGGKRFADGLNALDIAAGNGEDERALELLRDLLEEAFVADPEASSGLHRMVGAIGDYLWLKGAEPLIGRLVSLAEERPWTSIWGVHELAISCVRGWTGREDIYYRTLYWYATRGREMFPNADILWEIGTFADKLRAFGREREASDWVRWWVTEAEDTDLAEGFAYLAPKLIWRDCPDALRGRLIALACETLVRYEQEGHVPYQGQAERLKSIVGYSLGQSPQAQKAKWSAETADILVGVGMQFPKPASRALALNEAAGLYDAAGQLGRASECRLLAKELAADDPGTLLQWSLSSARGLARDGKWEAAGQSLEEAVGRGAGATQAHLQASLLLHEAYLRTGKPTEAEKWIEKAWELVNSLTLTAAEKANHLMSMANLCDLAVQLADGKAGGK